MLKPERENVNNVNGVNAALKISELAKSPPVNSAETLLRYLQRHLYTPAGV
jgi:hypothetical protein